MIITWYGQSCFKLQDSKQTVLIDPYSPRKAGLRGPNLKAAIMLLTDPEDEKKVKPACPAGRSKLKKECFLISGPGEYEMKNIFVYGLPFLSKKKQMTIYHLEIRGISFGILGEIDNLLNNEQLESLDGIEVLFVPVGGKNMINGQQAIEIINSLEPKLVVPSCYKVSGLKYNLSTIDKFLKETGIKDVEKLNKLSLHKRHLPQKETKIIVLEKR